MDRGAAELRCIPDIRSCRQSPVYHDVVFWLSRQRGRQAVGLVLQLRRQSFFVGLGWGGASEGRMRPRGVIEVEPLGNGPLGGEAV